MIGNDSSCRRALPPGPRRVERFAALASGRYTGAIFGIPPLCPSPVDTGIAAKTRNPSRKIKRFRR